MIDSEKIFYDLQNDLTEINIMQLYDLMQPIRYDSVTAKEITDRREHAIDRYHSDNMFRARVQSVTYHSMDIIRKHLKEVI